MDSLKNRGIFFFVLFITIFLLASTIPPSGSIIEEHDSNESSAYLGKVDGYQIKQAQQFYLDEEDVQPISGLGILLKSTDYGSPTGDITLSLYDNADGNIPGTLIPGSEKTLTPVLGEWNYISYSDQTIILNTGSSNKYWIVASTVEQSGDNDAYCWHRSTSNTYDRGYRKTYNLNGSGEWSGSQVGDFAFRIYGDVTLSVHPFWKPLPDEFELFDNYPNPFNPSTKIEYKVSGEGSFCFISLKIYNILGEEVVTLVDKIHSPGKYSADWNGCDKFGKEVSSGIYFYQLVSEGRVVQTKRMVKMK